MLQQMLVDDKCDQVRAVCSQSLAMVINEIDDQSRLSQVDESPSKHVSHRCSLSLKCIDLLDRCLLDTSDVVQSAKRYLLPSIAIWCLELNQVYHIIIEHYLKKLELVVQVSRERHFLIFSNVHLTRIFPPARPSIINGSFN